MLKEWPDHQRTPFSEQVDWEKSRSQPYPKYGHWECKKISHTKQYILLSPSAKKTSRSFNSETNPVPFFHNLGYNMLRSKPQPSCRCHGSDAGTNLSTLRAPYSYTLQTHEFQQLVSAIPLKTGHQKPIQSLTIQDESQSGPHEWQQRGRKSAWGTWGWASWATAAPPPRCPPLPQAWLQLEFLQGRIEMLSPPKP